MRVLLGNPGSRELRRLIRERSDLGMLLSPQGWHRPTPEEFYCCDNDAFGHRNDPDWWCREGERRWLRMLDRLPADHTPGWVLLPDVVANWPKTLERAWIYREEALQRGLRYAVALQDGCRFEEVLPLQPTAVFVGGTRRWKWLHVEPITRFYQPLGISVHVGRASGRSSVSECLRVGVDQCDGTGFSRFSRAMMPVLLSVLDRREAKQQGVLDL